MTNVIMTAYCACALCCGPGGPKNTAAGVRPVQGITVAAPRAVPLGTVVEIAGIGRRMVQDRTARRYDGRWDLYFDSHAEALRFGKTNVSIRILRVRAQRQQGPDGGT